MSLVKVAESNPLGIIITKALDMLGSALLWGGGVEIIAGGSLR